MLLTEGTLNLSQIPSLKRRSRISQANIPASFCLSSRIYSTTCYEINDIILQLFLEQIQLTLGVVTLGLLPPIAPGNMEPVS